MDPQAPPPATNAKQQTIERLREASNVLVTVSNSPSVDQLAACIGFTIMLNKLGKHGTAVFSGSVPSTLEFLQPEKTLEKNTDSLRDFIIALDKAKADKLRYKVEDKYVKIFITPYRTSISDKDLDFSQGDFNVDAVVALGVHRKEELDQAITAHGRILHDATVISVNTKDGTDVGTINWRDETASSLSEMLVSVGEAIKPDILDSQMSTAFLTGIVAETERFSNNKTSPATMTVAARLMNAGANQQLIATKLEKPAPVPVVEKDTFHDKKMDELAAEKTEKPKAPPKSNDGSLKIVHNEGLPAPMPAVYGNGSDEEQENQENIEEIHIDDEGMLHRKEDEKSASNGSDAQNGKLSSINNGPHMVLQPPTMGGRLTANSEPENLDPSTDPLSLPSVDQPLLNRIDSVMADHRNDTLEDIEESVESPHAQQDKELEEKERAAQQAAELAEPQRLEPMQRLGSTPVDFGQSTQDTDSPLGPPPPGPPPMMPPQPNGQPSDSQPPSFSDQAL